MDFIELLQSKSVLSALAGVLIALNKKYRWIEIDDDTLIVIASVVLAAIVASLRRSNQKIEKAVNRTEDAAIDAATTARAGL